MQKVLLWLCATCLSEADKSRSIQLARAIVDAGLSDRVEVVAQDCMNACANPIALSLQGVGRATYFFAGVDLQRDIADILTTLKAYLADVNGWIGDARSCGRLRYCLVGRVPALDNTSSIASPEVPGQTAK